MSAHAFDQLPAIPPPLPASPSTVLAAQRIMYGQALLLCMAGAYLFSRMSLISVLATAMPLLLLLAVLAVIAMMVGRLRFRMGAIAVQLVFVFPFLLTALSVTVASPLTGVGTNTMPGMVLWFLMSSVPTILTTTFGGAQLLLVVPPALSALVIALLVVPKSSVAFTAASEARETGDRDRPYVIDLD